MQISQKMHPRQEVKIWEYFHEYINFMTSICTLGKNQLGVKKTVIRIRIQGPSGSGFTESGSRDLKKDVKSTQNNFTFYNL